MGPCWALGLLLALAPILLGLSPARQPTLPQWQGFQAQQVQGLWGQEGMHTSQGTSLFSGFL